jgi:6-pyruvoyltetrahydropterin/6-carboxytetrahydropterin synthase
MFAIEVETQFSAAHALRLPGGASERLHGHDFRATIKISATTLDAIDTVLDFHEVEAALDLIIGPWKNANLNEVEPFRSTVNPSAERIAEYLGRQIQSLVREIDPTNSRGLRLVEVRLTEAPGCLAVWSAE